MRRYLYIILLSALCAVACNRGGDDGGEGDNYDGYANICENIAGGDYENCGDFYKTNATNWLLELHTADFSEIVRLELQTDTSAATFEGDFQIDNSRQAGSAVAGFVNAGVPCGCCWVRYDDSYKLAEYKLFVSGDISINRSGEGYHISLKAKTADGKRVSVEYDGALSSWATLKSAPAERLRIRLLRR